MLPILNVNGSMSVDLVRVKLLHCADVKQQLAFAREGKRSIDGSNLDPRDISEYRRTEHVAALCVVIGRNIGLSATTLYTIQVPTIVHRTAHWITRVSVTLRRRNGRDIAFLSDNYEVAECEGDEYKWYGLHEERLHG